MGPFHCQGHHLVNTPGSLFTFGRTKDAFPCPVRSAGENVRSHKDVNAELSFSSGHWQLLSRRRCGCCFLFFSFLFFVLTMSERNILKPNAVELHGECCLPPPPLCRRQIAQAILDLARDGWIARGVFSQRAEASDRDEHGDKSRVMAFLLRYLHWISSGESRIQSNPSRFS